MKIEAGMNVKRIKQKLQNFMSDDTKGLEDFHEFITVEDVMDMIKEIERLHSINNNLKGWNTHVSHDS